MYYETSCIVILLWFCDHYWYLISYCYMYKCINNSLTPLANGHIHIDLSISLHPIGHLKLVAECNIPFVDLRFSGAFRVCGAFSDSNNALICLIDVSNRMA